VSKNGSPQGHPLARERLEPIIRALRPDLHSSIILLRSLVHVYYNIRYIGVDVAMTRSLEELKREGVLCHQAFDTFLAIYADLGLSLRELRLLRDLIPDHLVGPSGEIVWVADKPPKWHQCGSTSPADKPSSDEDGSTNP
jgi:hypothetical protein